MRFSFRRTKTASGLDAAIVGDQADGQPTLILYAAPRAEVVAGDVEGIRKLLKDTLLASVDAGRRYFQSLVFNVQGYDDDPRELYDIEECRRWFQQLDERFPYLIYFVRCDQHTLYIGSQKGNNGGRLTIEALRTFFRDRKPALRELAERIGFTEEQVSEALRRAASAYIGVEIQPW